MKPAWKVLESQVTKAVCQYLEMRGWRAVRMQSGMFESGYEAKDDTKKAMLRIGEPGMPDWLFIRYEGGNVKPHPGDARVMWVEMKRPGARQTCRCGLKNGKMKKCTRCRQIEWRTLEQERGALVVTVSDAKEFAVWYEDRFRYLQTSPTAVGVGQMAMDLKP